MDRTTLLIIVLAFFVLLVVLASIGWERRRRRQGSIAAPLPVPADIGTVIAQVEGLYVSTTPDGQPLNRIAVHGLAFRSRATITVAEAGVILGLPGRDIFIPAADLREVTRAQYTIDRVVEPGGLVLVAWTLGDSTAGGSGAKSTALDTYLRVDQTQFLVDSIASLIPHNSLPHNQREKA